MFLDMLSKLIMFPMIFVAGGLIACCMGIASFCSKPMSNDPHKDLNFVTYVSSGLTIVSGLIMSKILFGGISDLSIVNFSVGWASPWIAAAIGVASGVIIGAIAEYYTSDEYNPTKNLSQASLEGPALTITQGLALGMKSTMFPCVILAAGIIVSYYVSGMYGVAMAAVGMLSFVAATVSVDTYGPISDNAGGIAEMTGLLMFVVSPIPMTLSVALCSHR